MQSIRITHLLSFVSLFQLKMLKKVQEKKQVGNCMLENKGPASDAWTAPLSALSGLLLLLLQKSCALLPPKLYSTTKTPKPHYLSYRASYSSCSRPAHSPLPPKLQNPIICSIRRPDIFPLLLQKSSALLTLKLCGHHDNQCVQYFLLPRKKLL